MGVLLTLAEGFFNAIKQNSDKKLTLADVN